MTKLSLSVVNSLEETMEFPATLPPAIPANRVLAHNSVRPGRYQGERGFRFWFAVPAAHYVSCSCGWAPHLGAHYRVQR